MKKTTVLMSIKPEYVDKIFEGQKTLELRRICPKVAQGDSVVIYASGPKMALVGGFEVEGITSWPTNLTKKDQLKKACVSQQVFEDYFKGTDTAYGIKIGKTWQFHSPKALQSLRLNRKGFMPPQSYRYIKHEELASFLEETPDNLNESFRRR